METLVGKLINNDGILCILIKRFIYFNFVVSLNEANLSNLAQVTTNEMLKTKIKVCEFG